MASGPDALQFRCFLAERRAEFAERQIAELERQFGAEGGPTRSDVSCGEHCANQILATALGDADSEDRRSVVASVSRCSSSPCDQRLEDIRLAARASLEQWLQDASGATTKPPQGARPSAREQARNALLGGLESGRLVEAMHEVAEERAASSSTEGLRLKAKDVLFEALRDGSLELALAECRVSDRTVATKVRGALLGGLEDGRLEDALAEATASARARRVDGGGGGSPAATRAAFLTGLEDAVGEGTTRALVPVPPADPCCSGRLVGGRLQLRQLVEVGSSLDRRIGDLQHRIAEARREVSGRDADIKMMEARLEATLSDLRHVTVDVEWHQQLIGDAVGRETTLNDARRSLALKLDEMRRSGAAPGANTAPRSVAAAAAGGKEWNSHRALPPLAAAAAGGAA